MKKTAWMRSWNADGMNGDMGSHAGEEEHEIKSRVLQGVFWRTGEKGFGVAQPSSPDYVVDIRFKGKTIAFFTKADLIEKNPFAEVSEKQIERLWSMAKATGEDSVAVEQEYTELLCEEQYAGGTESARVTEYVANFDKVDFDATDGNKSQGYFSSEENTRITGNLLRDGRIIILTVQWPGEGVSLIPP
ncbi:MAG: hypothetical protein NC305_06320 [Lachnospiraceae bacterium]|nr:hypothetical protein [Lachnospiraceae bacterium]